MCFPGHQQWQQWLRTTTTDIHAETVTVEPPPSLTDCSTNHPTAALHRDAVLMTMRMGGSNLRARAALLPLLCLALLLLAASGEVAAARSRDAPAQIRGSKGERRSGVLKGGQRGRGRVTVLGSLVGGIPGAGPTPHQRRHRHEACARWGWADVP